jgi:hypothetical protein
MFETWHNYWHHKDFINEMKKIVALMGAILTIIATLITAIFGAGGIFVVPAVNNFLYPKFTPIAAKVLLNPNQGFLYCVNWQKNQNYNIMLSSDSDPMQFKILNYSEYREMRSTNSTISIFALLNGVYDFSGPYTPTEDGYYFIYVQRATGSWYKNVFNSNQSLTFNISVEAYGMCPPDIWNVTNMTTPTNEMNEVKATYASTPVPTTVPRPWV